VTVPAADNLRPLAIEMQSTTAVDCINDYVRVVSILSMGAKALVRADDLLDAIAALHQEYTPSGRCETCDHGWPCPTARLLQGEGE
jgi:hypothetical protein